MANDKRRTIAVFENLARRLAVIDEAQCEILGSIDTIRESVGGIAEDIKVIKPMVESLETASTTDAREISQILARMDEMKGWKDSVDNLTRALGRFKLGQPLPLQVTEIQADPNVER